MTVWICVRRPDNIDVSGISIGGAGLSLMQVANGRTIDAVRLVSEDPNALLEGMVSLQTARIESRIAATLARTSTELDASTLDILA